MLINASNSLLSQFFHQFFQSSVLSVITLFSFARKYPIFLAFEYHFFSIIISYILSNCHRIYCYCFGYRCFIHFVKLSCCYYLDTVVSYTLSNCHTVTVWIPLSHIPYQIVILLLFGYHCLIHLIKLLLHLLLLLACHCYPLNQIIPRSSLLPILK